MYRVNTKHSVKFSMAVVAITGRFLRSYVYLNISVLPVSNKTLFLDRCFSSHGITSFILLRFHKTEALVPESQTNNSMLSRNTHIIYNGSGIDLLITWPRLLLYLLKEDADIGKGEVIGNQWEACTKWRQMTASEMKRKHIIIIKMHSVH